MRTDFDDDPGGRPNNRPFYIYGVVFIIGLGISVGIGWFFHLERLGNSAP